MRSLPARGWLTALGGLTLVAVAVVTGEGAAVIALAWASVARATQWTRVAAARRRWRAGRLSASAATGLAVAYPVRLVGALLASVGFAAVALLVISPVLLIGAAVLLQGVPLSDLGLVRDTVLVAPVRSGLAVLLGLALWAGPGGRAVRDGSRAMTDRAAGSQRGAVVLAATYGLVVVSAVVVLLRRGPLA